MTDTPPEREQGSAQAGTEHGERQRRLALLAMLEDLQASHAQIERARKEWADAFDAIRDPVFLHDRDFRIVRANRACAEAAGMDIKDVIGKRYWEVFPKNTGPLPACARRMEKAEEEEEEEVTLETGATYVSRAYAVRDEQGHYLHSIHIFEDVTERKRAVETLRKSVAELKEAQRVARLGSWDMDTKTGNVTWSEELYRTFGRDPMQPAPGYEEHSRILAPESYARMNTAIEKTRQTGEPYELDLELIRPDGTRKWITARGAAKRDLNSQIIGLRGTALDITERKRAEAALQRSNRALATLSGVNQVLIKVQDERSLLSETCRVIVETGGYRFAWIGYVEHDEEKTVRPVAYRGFEEGYLESLRLTWADTERGRGPSGRAIRSGKPVLTQDILNDPAFAPWRAEAVARGYASSISLPLLGADTVFGVLSIYSAEAGAFDAAEVVLLQELADGFAFGILTLRTRSERDHLQEERLRSIDRMKQALIDTIRAIALTVEKRDPYTAGHQQRVAELCLAIGRELNLPEDRIEGMRLAALIHDIGKIYVPAEILNRPGKLSKAEFEMIQTHPEVGYDIVKDVKFPWPVGQMILQHHERMDGSGYPKALKGEEIILEARIMAVADTVEAMSSHRPYRPALGFEKALAEIEKNRGITYDAAAVDTCLKLFRKGDFSFSVQPER